MFRTQKTAQLGALTSDQHNTNNDQLVHFFISLTRDKIEEYVNKISQDELDKQLVLLTNWIRHLRDESQKPSKTVADYRKKIDELISENKSRPVPNGEVDPEFMAALQAETKDLEESLKAKCESLEALEKETRMTVELTEVIPALEKQIALMKELRDERSRLQPGKS
jgi:hypothetical protein